MTARHLALIVAAVATFGLGVYLLVAVRSTAPAVAAQDRETTPAPRAARPDTPPTETKITPTRVPSTEPPPVEEMPEPERVPLDLKKDEMMAAANKAYDRQEFEEAVSVARRVLGSDPTNVRMLRIVVSASCILDDAASAQKSYLLLPTLDREQMRSRCSRYGVTFTES